MSFAEKLKSLRKMSGMSQELMAEKLNVSRQAVTKWETAVGIPDIENLLAISALFNITVDELLGNDTDKRPSADFPYESVTEYDVDQTKSFDINLGGANRLVVRGCAGEKLRVRLASDKIATLSNDYKVKIDDNKKRIDVDIVRKNGATVATAKDAVTIFVELPQCYTKRIEIAVIAQTVEISELTCEVIELDAKIRSLILSGVVGTVDITCNLDMNIDCNTLNGSVEINQLSATSKITVPSDAQFVTRVRGINTTVFYEQNGARVDPFCQTDADNVIELNGIKSELIICRDEK